MKFIEKKRGFGISARLAMIFILIILCLISFMTTVLYRFFLDRTQETVQSSVQNAIYTKTESLRAIISQIETASTILCDDSKIYAYQASAPNLYRMLRNYDKNGQVSEAVEEYRRMEETLESYFHFLDAYGVSCSYALYIDENWKFAQRLRPIDGENAMENTRGIYSAREVSDETWYQTAIMYRGSPCWFSGGEQSGRLYMSKLLYCRVLEGNSFETYLLGVLSVGIDVSWIARQLNQDASVGTSYVAIRNRENRILYANESLPESIVLPGAVDSSEKNGEQGEWIAADLPLSEELGAVMVMPTEYLYISNSQSFRMILFLGLITVFLGGLIIVVFSKMITRPVKALAFHMESGSPVPLQRGLQRRDEVGMLYRGYNSLVERIGQLVQNVTKAAETKKKAELRALQAQINPHFVYNTLDTICCLMMLDGREDVADILVALSQIMRYNTKKPEELVPLSKEIDILQKYYLIQKACYEDSIVLQCEADENTLNCLVPKQVVQPLVENAILHGTDVASGKGHIRVTTFFNRNMLKIDVWDNGRKADVDEINRWLKDPTPAEQSESIGIKNINERLHYVYGSEAGLTYLWDQDGYTVARIWISNPKRTEMEKEKHIE